MGNSVFLAAVLVAAVLLPATGSASYAERDEVKAFAEELSKRHSWEASEIQALFAQASKRQDIIEKISKPAEKVWTWGKYKNLLVTQERVDAGAQFWCENRSEFDRAQEKYGVDAAYLTAIIGIETYYGRHTGKYPVLESLLTLAFDYPPRSRFFKSELEQFLILTREEAIDPVTMKGSYAGAMGLGQFISSSYRHYAVDFDGDGQRDLLNNRSDAIGSVANYFAKHKWQGKHAVARQVVPQTAAQTEVLDALAKNSGLKPETPLSDIPNFAQLLPGSEGDQRVTVKRLINGDNVEYWLGFHDFYVITRYNHSHLYALAVEHLARDIRTAKQEQCT